MALFWRRRRKDDLNQELRAHFEEAVRERIERGQSREQAEAAARREFGNAALVAEVTRDQWGWVWLETLLQDARYGLRQLRRSPAFTSVAVLTLALGIGVNLAAFHFLNFLAFRPLPVRDPDSIVRLTPESPGSWSSSVSYPALDFYRRHNTVLSAVLGSADSELTFDRNPADRISAKFVTANFFAELGATPAYGRLLDPQSDDDAAAEPVAVLSHAFWQSRFASDPSILGKTVHLNMQPVTVIGVAPYDFTGLDAEGTAVWLPIARHPDLVAGSRLLSDHAMKSILLYGRLRPGVSMRQAEEGLKPLVAELRRQHPDQFAEKEILAARPGAYLGDLSRAPLPLLAFFAALVLLILVIACANLGNLMLARAVTREREIDIRFAVGASRARVIRQLLTESVLLALLGSVAGAAVAAVAVRVALVIIMDVADFYRFALDARVFLVAFSLALLAAIVFGLAPALAATRKGHRGNRWRRVLITMQVAASCVLLIVSGLMVRSMRVAFTAPPGFEYERVVVVDPALGLHGYQDEAAAGYLADLRQRVNTMPGVEAASVCTMPPLGGRRTVLSGDEPRRWEAFANDVDPGYFRTMGIPLLRGRNFSAGERRNVVIVSENLARQLWPAQDAIGQTFSESLVVGVAGRARTGNLSDPDAAEIYFPLQQRDSSSAVLLVKTAGPPESHLEPLRVAAESLDFRVSPAATLLKNAYHERMRASGRSAMVVSSLGLLAALLAAIGVYGLVSYAVSERQKEMGIRLALGAARSDILVLVLRQFLRPVGIGVAVGLTLAAGLSLALRSLLFGLSNFDPASYAGAVLLFLALASVAGFVPARRAMRVDPLEVLRHE